MHGLCPQQPKFTISPTHTLYHIMSICLNNIFHYLTISYSGKGQKHTIAQCTVLRNCNVKKCMCVCVCVCVTEHVGVLQ